MRPKSNRPPDLPTHCDGCQAKFSISHALDSKYGRIVTACHNVLCDGVADLSRKDFTPSHMRNNPLIYSGRAAKRTKATPAGARRNTYHAVAPPLEVTEQKGYLMTITSSSKVHIVFTTWGSVTPTPSGTGQRTQRGACRRRKGGRSGYTWRHASISADTPHPFSPRCINCWRWRQRQP